MLLCATTSFTLMPVPDALCIIFACPVVTIFLSALVLKDRINIPKVAAGLALFTGVVCVSKPPFIFQSVFHKITENHGTIPEAIEALINYLSKHSQDLPQVTLFVQTKKVLVQNSANNRFIIFSTIIGLTRYSLLMTKGF